MIVARSQSFQADFSSVAFHVDDELCGYGLVQSYTALRGKEKNGVLENGYMMMHTTLKGMGAKAKWKMGMEMEMGAPSRRRRKETENKNGVISPESLRVSLLGGWVDGRTGGWMGFRCSLQCCY